MVEADDAIYSMLTTLDGYGLPSNCFSGQSILIPAGESADYKVAINLEPGYDASSCDISSIVKGRLP